MKWFFSLNDSGKKASEYQKQAKVAVCSAKKNTSLEPYCLYDGVESEFTVWLRAQGVTVYFHRTPLYAEIKKINASKLPIASGALLRCEIPKVLTNNEFDDEYVLYTDVDIVFIKDPTTALQEVKCDYFAVSRESLHNRDTKNMNSGVMLMNVHGFLRVYDSFLTYSSDNLHLILTQNLGYDQYLLKTYFEKQWEWLPETMNWKGHWTLNPSAFILHFHGPKPTDISDIFKKGINNYRLPGLASEAFFENVLNIWQPLYQEIITDSIDDLQNEADRVERYSTLIAAHMASAKAFRVSKTLRSNKSAKHFLGFNVNPDFKPGESHPQLQVKGWVVSKSNNVQRIETLYGSVLLFSSQLCEQRPDVLQHFPEVSRLATVGFSCERELSPRELSEYFGNDSTPTLAVRAVLDNGDIIQLAEIELSIQIPMTAGAVTNSP